MDLSERDSKFVAGSFLEAPVNSEKYWMKKYFKTQIQYQFLKYFDVFRSIVNFVNHTGFVCTILYLKKMRKKYICLEKTHNHLKSIGDFENIAKLEMGKYKKIK